MFRVGRHFSRSCVRGEQEFVSEMHMHGAFNKCTSYEVDHWQTLQYLQCPCLLSVMYVSHPAIVTMALLSGSLI